MGTEPGKNIARLIEDLEKNSPNYNVFQAIFIGEKISKGFFPDRQDDKFEQKGLKFRPYEMYVFPPTDIRKISFTDKRMEFVLNFMGLYGVNSPFPRCYHEQVAIQQSIHGGGEVPIQNFLDIFNNRFYWLYYQGWKKYRYFLELREDLQSKSTQRIFSFIGLGPRFEKIQSYVSPFKLIQLSGILNNRIRNKMGLRILLKDFFPGCEVRIREFVPNRVPLSEIPRLGGGEMILGQNTVLGRSVVDYLSKICIQMGPIEFDDYLNFLPDEKKTSLLKEIIEIYLSDNIEYDVEFLVKTEGMKFNPLKDKRLKLGQSIWLGKPAAKVVKVYYRYEKLLKVA